MFVAAGAERGHPTAGAGRRARPPWRRQGDNPGFVFGVCAVQPTNAQLPAVFRTAQIAVLEGPIQCGFHSLCEEITDLLATTVIGVTLGCPVSSDAVT